MMGVPPFNRFPGNSSTPSSSSSGSPEKSRRSDGRKEFNIKGRDADEKEKEQSSMTKKEEDEGEKSAAQILEKVMTEMGEYAKGLTTEEVKGLTKAEAQVATAKVAEIIQKMVAGLQVGTIGGKDFASVDLKGTQDVPDFLKNTSLTLTQTTEGLIIRFSNFESPQQQAQAIYAIEQNKEQLQQLMANLQQKNIAIADLQIGNHSITLPKVTAATETTPIQPSSAATEMQKEKRWEKERGEQGGQGREQKK